MEPSFPGEIMARVQHVLTEGGAGALAGSQLPLREL